MPLHKPIRVIIAGGGTGGHVFPAISIANALKQKVLNIQILFVGAKGRLEMKKVPEAGYHILGLKISGLQRKLTFKNFVVLYRLIDSMIRSKNIIKRFKPDLVIGVGGYASFPIVKSAIKKKIPTLIQEQNSYPGVSNKILGKKADKICVAYEGMERFFPKEKIYLTGNPIRKEILDFENKKEEAYKYFNLSKEKKTLLVFGGTLGAKSINEAIKVNLKLFLYNDVQIIWQTGKLYYQDATEYVKGLEKFDVRVYEFIDRMDLAYSLADVIVSRSGAIAVSEICAIKKPAVFIPSPNVAEDHQTKNALALVNHHAAVMVKDHEVKEKIGFAVMNLFDDDEKRFKLIEKIAGLAYYNAADNIAEVALSIVK
ncbi:MAG: undecaprenyldiphospho-muramoylpentapeptide beta-N-acetylglucosaminyltransferase [Bacteroidetes bacterium]|nr:undecaprenyldiphospho-muramoylpentapeptide beta-N-acetylglucosaminyltransferase [Bacteroidota bacterium]